MIDGIACMMLEDILIFATGADEVPPFGFVVSTISRVVERQKAKSKYMCRLH